MSLTALNGAQTLLDAKHLKNVLQELQGLTITPVAGAAAGVKMNIAAIREEDTIAAALLQGGVTTVGVSEVQHIAVDATSGTYTITWGGQTTAAIAFNALASAVQTALENLSNIAVGDVVVTGGVGASGGANPYVLTWATYLGNVAQPTCTSVDLAGGGASVTPSTTTSGVQQIGGLFTDDKANITIVSTHASAAVTISGNPTADETVTVNGVVYTWKATPTAKTHVKITAGDNTAMATSLAAAINGYENRYEPRLHGDSYRVAAVTATSALGVVTVTSVADGVGSGPIVSAGGGTITVSSTDPGAVTATFVSAVNTNTVVVNGTTFTVKTTPVSTDLDMGVKASDTLQAAELVRAVNAYDVKYGTLDVIASSALGVVTLSARSGRSGNSIKLSEASTNVAATGSGYLAGGTATGGITSTTDLTGESLVVYWNNKQ